MDILVIGIDFGTDSCRALVVNATTGAEMAQHVVAYPRWAKGLYCVPDKNQYRQHPQDYIDTLEEAVKGALSQLPIEMAKNVVALGIDTTGSTPCLTDKNGTPLALLPEYAENPNAMFILWKDHTAIREADEINTLAHQWNTDYTARSGGIYSSEWFWAKALHALREDSTVREKAYAVIEHCDWMSAMLTGNLKPETVKRSRCAAGHKGMWAEEWNGYPSQQFLSTLDTLFDGFGNRISNQTYTSDIATGKLNAQWIQRLGLTEEVTVAVGIIDAHAGAIGAGIKSNTMVKIVGTSTCDIVVAPKEIIGTQLIPGISGQVDGSVIPELIGLEAGQSAFGDVYAWLKDLLAWTLDMENNSELKSLDDKILSRLTQEAKNLPLTEHDLIASDWLNGRRTPYADQTLKGGFSGLTLSTSPAHIFKSLVEATAFGSRAIMEHLQSQGIAIHEVIGVGGIALKSPYVMQTLSDVMYVEIKNAPTQQAGALGAAICAATAAGIYPTVEKAQEKLVKSGLTTYVPNNERKIIYNTLYRRYRQLGDYLQSIN